MTRMISWLTGTLLAAVCLPVAYGQTQGSFVYVNNETSTNSISAFQIASNGTLTPVPGSPFATIGVGGGSQALARFSNATIHTRNNFLFACNTLSHSVSAFTINPDGSLKAVRGSPFATGGRHPIAVVANPQGTLLFANNLTTNNLSVFAMAPDGALSPIPGSPFDLRPLTRPTGLTVNSTGDLLLIAGEGAVGAYSIAPDGTVTPVNAPVETGFNTQSLAITGNDQFVYAAGPDESDGIAGFRLSSEGQLTPLADSPFPAPAGGGLLGLSVNPKGNLLAATAAEASSVHLYRVDTKGKLSMTAGSPFPTQGTELKPICIDPTGSFALAADVAGHSIHVLRINSAARTLTEIATSPFALGSSGARPSGITVK